MIEERLSLAMERIGQIPEDTGVSPAFHDFFISAGRFLTLACEAREGRAEEKGGAAGSGKCRPSLAELRERQDALWRDLLPGNYANSWLSPAYAAERAGVPLGRALSALYAELTNAPKLIARGQDELLAALLELFLSVYGLFSGGEVPEASQVEERFYWYAFDYLDVTVPVRTEELYVPEAAALPDPFDPAALFSEGTYVTETTLRTAEYLSRLPEETVERAARAMADGFIEGFRVLGKDLSRKSTVQIRCVQGFERLVIPACEYLSERGLRPVVLLSPAGAASMQPGSTDRSRGLSVNPQFDYDHRFDQAVFWDKAFTDRKKNETEMAYEARRPLLSAYAGSAVQEAFGEPPFEPANCGAAYALSEKQRKLLRRHQSELMQLRERFIPGAEISFTIIAWPYVTLGEPFDEIFRDIVRVNTLDTALYRDLQQRIIDVLDACDHVEVKGAPGNETSLRVRLKTLSDPARETRFENCVADVNIPAGEVFTSPVLTGTEGRLHVSEVYVGGILVRDLKIDFKDGRTGYASCANFGTEEENKAFVRENVLSNHEWLPIGEFAIGTNTLASAMAARYGIADRLPILIAEKTGPHFAVGDTCYSREEDEVTFNPDGKAITARDNECSRLRKEKPEEAYFNCHTDITIPYDEIGELSAVSADGIRTDIIRNGRFVLPGLSALNEPLDQM